MPSLSRVYCSLWRLYFLGSVFVAGLVWFLVFLCKFIVAHGQLSCFWWRLCVWVCVCVYMCLCLSVNKLETTVFKAETSYLGCTSTMIPSRSLLKLVAIRWGVWPLEVKESKICSFLENYGRKRLHLYCRHIGNHTWAFIWCHDLWPWTKVKRSNGLFPQISRKLREIETVDIWEIIYGLPFGAMTFDLEPRAKGQMGICWNISKATRDRDSICIVDV